MADLGERELFPLGRVVATPGALATLEEAGQEAIDFLDRHSCGNWGILAVEDWELNNEALRHGRRLLSSYRLASGDKIWIITEADRSATTLLLPDEY